MASHRAYKRTKNGEVIDGPSKLVDVLNVSLDTDLAAVQIPAGTTCKHITVRESGGNSFLISEAADGDTITFSTGFSLDLAAGDPDAAETIFYAKVAADTGTLEVALWD